MFFFLPELVFRLENRSMSIFTRTVKRVLSFNLRVLIDLNIRLHFPASITNSKNKAKPESDVTQTDKETVNFVDDTSKGKDSCYPLIRIRCWTGKLFNVNLHSCERTELSAWIKK